MRGCIDALVSTESDPLGRSYRSRVCSNARRTGHPGIYLNTTNHDLHVLKFMPNRKYIVLGVLLLAVAGAGLALAVGPMSGDDGSPSDTDEPGEDNRTETSPNGEENGTVGNGEENGTVGNGEENGTAGNGEENGTAGNGEANDLSLPWDPGPPEINATIPGTFTPPDPESKPGELSANGSPLAEFEDVASEAGLTYNTSDTLLLTPHRHGSFVADINNDGYEDLLLLGGESPTLFENQGGEYAAVREFEPYNGSTFVPTAHFFDHNNNGYQDLLLFGSRAEPVLYENRGGEFVRSNVTFNRSIYDPRTVTSADFTGNGCLDLYIGSWIGPNSSRPTKELLELAQKHPDIRPNTPPGGTNVLLKGSCGGFEDITNQTEVNRGGWTFATSAVDFTGNGHTDIHVANDFSTDYVYENQGNATFEPIKFGPNADRNGMSSTAIDVTGNHLPDIFVTNVYFENPPPAEELVPIHQVALPYGNNLFANQGNGEFVDIAPKHGLDRGSWGWASTIADYNNDGHLDVIHASMYVSSGIVSGQPESFRYPQVWNGTEDSWQKVNGAKLGFAQHNLRGVTRVDYDGDGALDFVAVGDPSSASVNGAEVGSDRTFLYENQLESEEYLQLWVRNPDGIARNAGVYIETDERTIYREANARSDFQSQDSRLIHAGLENEQLERVVVEWPDGGQTAYDSLEEGERYMLFPDGADLVE